MSSLDEQDEDITTQVQQTVLEWGMRVYLQKMKIQRNRLKIRMNTQTNPLKMRGRRVRRSSEFE